MLFFLCFYSFLFLKCFCRVIFSPQRNFSHLSLTHPPLQNAIKITTFFPLLSAISMDNKSLNQEPQTLSPRASNCNSPEFEFWMLRNPSFPQPNLLSADELFVDGVLLPLHLLPATNKSDPPPETPNSEPPVHDPDPERDSGPESSPAITDSSSSTFSSSKRWKDLFRKSEKKKPNNNPEGKEKGKKKERKNTSGSSSAELNINIWPFSRSRSAGNTGTRPRLFPGAPATRKVNSAPCSRSNSAGESKSRKWPSSPGRAGVHVGRSSPVWQVRHGGSKNSQPQILNADKKGSKRENPTIRRSKVAAGGSGSSKARVLNLNVPTCISYRHPLSCRSDENSAISLSGAATTDGGVRGNNGGGNGGDCNDGGSGGNLFNLRNLFTKKSILTSH
ncbi:uncharacterized protein LOC133287261 [Gastrolobium bilobum]|uniref:uncharacterized protein LOC133287261 n=1 Tax=Gastrolobium bilobum TaxID=150636 RepID=UPI002AAFA3F4|nr:uncharacterized protein LOC133287261 [Gastrolobium bilobum]